MKVKSEGEVAQSCPTLATPWTAAYQAPPPMGFSKQEYWSLGCHCLLRMNPRGGKLMDREQLRGYRGGGKGATV